MKLAIGEKTDQAAKILFRMTGVMVIAILAGIFFMLLWNTVAFFLK